MPLLPVLLYYCSTAITAFGFCLTSLCFWRSLHVRSGLPNHPQRNCWFTLFIVQVFYRSAALPITKPAVLKALNGSQNGSKVRTGLTVNYSYYLHRGCYISSVCFVC